MTNRHAPAVAAVAVAMAEIDPANTVALLAENARYAGEVDAAITKAEADLADIAEQIGVAHRAGPDHRAAADALLAGGDVVTASKPIESLERRRTALGQGLRGLRERAESLRTGRKGIERQLGERFAGVGELLYPSFIAEAQDVAGRLAQLYANARAAAAATGSGSLTYLAERLADPLASLARHSLHEKALIDGTTLSIDPGLANALGVGSEALSIARRAVPDTIHLPQATPDSDAYRAGLAAGHAATART